jgi:hypothetical protein
MPNVGFCGGSSVSELGPASDMRVFFGCLELAFAASPHSDGGLLTDRLYRRYLRLDQLDSANELLENIRIMFGTIHTNDIDWKSIHWNSNSTKLVLSAPTVDHVLTRYLVGAQKRIHDAQSFEKRFGIYQPVMTIISDLPRFVIDSKRPLAQYDALEDEPLWLR